MNELMLLIVALFFCSVSSAPSSRVVTLNTIQIYSTHELLAKPIVYFKCKGEKMTVLPDVTKKDLLYEFKGAESWQPLTDLSDNKCKRCGFYEKDTLSYDDVFDEWELCPDDFIEGKYIRFKDKEFNATFLCSACTNSTASLDKELESSGSTKKINLALVVTISVLASIVAVVGVVAGYKYWQKRKREHDQARFLKLFEETDELEDELGLDPVL